MAEEALGRLGDPFERTAKALQNELFNVANQTQGLAEEMQQLLSVNKDLTATFRALRESASKSSELTSKEKRSKEEASRATLEFVFVTDRLIGSFARIASGANAATESISAASILLAKFSPAAAIFASGVRTIIEAMDNEKIARREAVNVILQTGVSYREHKGAVEAARLKLRETASAWGMTSEQAAKFQALVAGAGIGARAGEAGEARAARVGEELATAFNVAQASSKAYGIALEDTTRYVIQLGTTLNVSSENWMQRMGELGEVGGKTALGQRRYLESVFQVTEMTKKHGANLEGISFLVGAFGDQIKRGTVSLDVIAKLSAPGEMATSKLAFLATEMERLGIEIDGVSLAGRPLAQQLRLLDEAAAKGTAEFPKALLQVLRGISNEIGPQAYLAVEPLFEQFGLNLSRLPAAQLLEGNLDEMAKTIGESSKSAGQNLEAAGQQVFKDFRTSGERYVLATEMFRDAVNKFGPIAIGFAALGGVISAIKGIAAFKAAGAAVAPGAAAATGLGAMIPGAAKSMLALPAAAAVGTKAAMAGTLLAGAGAVRYGFERAGLAEPVMTETMEHYLSNRSRQTGGFVPDTGPYLLHAGERVMRQGQGGGISVSVGGVSVSVGERGDLRGELHEAMMQVESRVLQQIEEQWRAATLAG